MPAPGALPTRCQQAAHHHGYNARVGAESKRSGPVLYLGCIPFRTLRQRPQQLAIEISRRADLLYIEPHRSQAGRLASPDWLVEEPPGPGSSLEILDPPAALPASGYLPVLNRVNYRRTARAIRRRLAARGGGAPPRSIVVSFPKHLDLLRWFPGIPVCYDVMDEYPLFFDRWQGAVLARLHERLLRRADAVVVTSALLEERCRPFARAIARVPNGVDSAFHEACAAAEPDPGVVALPSPRIGFVGALGPWVDLEVVRTLAAAFPAGSVILVGPTSGPLPALAPNVHWLGPKRHAAIPALLRALEIAIVPFRASPLTDAVDPIKVYEYLSAGLPVIGTDLAGIADFGPLVARCARPSDWPEAARLAMRTRSEGERGRRRSFAAGQLWSQRAGAFLEVLRAAEAAHA